MAEGSHPLRIFLCHSSGDKQAVRDLYQRLRADDFDPWLDEENLLPGQDWEREISKAVRACDIVVVCLSRTSINKRGYVQKEIKYALDVADEQPEDTIYLIPLKLEECDIPLRLRRWHWVNLFDPTGYERLLNALRHSASTASVKSTIINRLPSRENTVTLPEREGKSQSSKAASEQPEEIREAKVFSLTVTRKERRGIWLTLVDPNKHFTVMCPDGSDQSIRQAIKNVNQRTIDLYNRYSGRTLEPDADYAGGWVSYEPTLTHVVLGLGDPIPIGGYNRNGSSSGFAKAILTELKRLR
jgi:hypothetical protein